MSEYLNNSVIDFVKKELLYKEEITPETSLQDDIKVYGDDIGDFLSKYSKEFSVDMSNYKWYFHTGEEAGCAPGAILFKPPNHRVKEIPITVALLSECAEKGKWIINYPECYIPDKRWDIIINRIFFLLIFLILVLLILL